MVYPSLLAAALPVDLSFLWYAMDALRDATIITAMMKTPGRVSQPIP
jgi:hypothetical protein